MSHRVRIGWGSSRFQNAVPELHRDDEYAVGSSVVRNTIEIAREHSLEQAEMIVNRTFPDVGGKTLKCILSVHVDGLEGAATRTTAEPLLKYLEKSVGKRKAEYVSITHTRIQRESKLGEVYTHQCAYIYEIRPLDPVMRKGKDESELATGELHDAFRSLLGSIAIAVLSRPDPAVYIQFPSH